MGFLPINCVYWFYSNFNSDFYFDFQTTISGVQLAAKLSQIKNYEKDCETFSPFVNFYPWM